MACWAGGRPPYAAVILIHGLTENAITGGYVRGKLALAGLDLSTPLPDWLDAVWAAYIEAPYGVLEKANAEMVKAQARVRPEEARETWGMLPEHRAMAGNLGQGPGLEAGRGQAPGVARRKGPGGTAAQVEQWAAQQGRTRGLGPRRRRG